ncbi:MAG: TonB-dependent receptor [Chitinophagaceae bacterium]|nr:TonB-dependent receptor [Chitinophagaceae bacterium]
MNRMKKLIGLMILVMVCYQSKGQFKSISGIVKDNSSGETLPGAVIACHGKKVLAGNDGRFMINLQMAVDSCLLVVSRIGYRTDTVEYLGGHLVVLLQASSQALTDVVVTGTMKAVQKTASPVPVEVYTPQFFRRNPTPSIFDALQQVNGVRPQLNCNVCNTGDIHINGLEGPYTMVLIDGMPIVSSLGSVYGLSGIPNSLVERIEVVKGPASSLYGSEAIGGLINVITKNPLKAPLVSVDLMATSWKEYNADLGVKYKPLKKVTGLMGLNYFNFNNRVDRNDDMFTDVTLQNRIAVFNKLSFERGYNRQASLAARYVYEDRWGGDLRWNKQFRGGDSLYGESIYTSRFELIGNYQLPVSEKLMFSWSYNSHVQRSAYGNTIFNAEQQVAFGQLTWDKTLGNHDLLAGAVFRYTDYDDNTTATMDTLSMKNKPDRTPLPGIFLQDELSIGNDHKLLAGIRWDHHPVHGNIITPRLAWKWSVSANDILRINAGTGFRVVNLFTEDHAALTGARVVEIRDELKPERSYNVNLNYVKKIYTSAYWATIDASAWYTHFTNRIIPDYLTDPDKIIYDNLDGYSVSKGISVNMDMGFTNGMKATIGTTFMDVNIRAWDSSGKKQTSRQLLTEKWSGNWSLSYSFKKGGWSIDYTGNIYGPMLLPLISKLDPRKPESPVWSIQNIQVTKKLKYGMELYGGVKNLLNWTPAKNNPFLIARSHDPFDKLVVRDNVSGAIKDPGPNGDPNPYLLSFDPNYVYAPNQGIRGFVGLRWTITNGDK